MPTKKTKAPAVAKSVPRPSTIFHLQPFKPYLAEAIEHDVELVNNWLSSFGDAMRIKLVCNEPDNPSHKTTFVIEANDDSKELPYIVPFLDFVDIIRLGRNKYLMAADDRMSGSFVKYYFIP